MGSLYSFDHDVNDDDFDYEDGNHIDYDDQNASQNVSSDFSHF